jgi:hypothetical protein
MVNTTCCLTSSPPDVVGSYDFALRWLCKDDEGKVRVTKHEKPTPEHEKPTQRGAWAGAALRAIMGIIFPSAILCAASAGDPWCRGDPWCGGPRRRRRRRDRALVGGMSRGNAKELGEHLDKGHEGQPQVRMRD